MSLDENIFRLEDTELFKRFDGDKMSKFMMKMHGEAAVNEFFKFLSEKTQGSIDKLHQIIMANMLAKAMDNSAEARIMKDLSEVVQENPTMMSHLPKDVQEKLRKLNISAVR